MIFYEGIYRLPGRGEGKTGPIGGWEYAWWVRLINFSMSQPHIIHLKPFAAYVTPSNEGDYRVSCAESLGKRICRDFNLRPDKLLWVEHFRDKAGRLQVATFIPYSHYGRQILFRVSWRPILANELKAMRSFIPETVFMDT